MKLSSAQATRIQEQFGTEALAEDHRAMERLKGAFGDHTFFLDSDGLNIVEPNSDDGNTGFGVVVRLATWTENRKDLRAHAPERLPVTIDLGDEGTEAGE